jgi:hypothetical protein
MRRAVALVLVLVVAACAASTACGDERTAKPSATTSRLPAPDPRSPSTPGAALPVSGSVIDRDTREPVPDVEVVLRGEHGDVTTKTAADGTFKLSVVRGPYRAFVRDARVMSTGMQGRIRLRALPRAELAGVADEKLMPLLEVDGETLGVELTVTVGAIINGFVTDPDGKAARDVVITAVPLEPLPFARGSTAPITAPIVRRIAPRPVLGTDTAISDEDGRFILRVPAGKYDLVANHPTYAGVGGLAELELAAGARVDTTLTLVKGCVISGKVVTADGSPPHDGALETSVIASARFGPTGRVESDGTFRWTTTESGFVTIRAWPWRQAASEPRLFECRDGKRYTDVVLAIPNAVPDIAGTISDARGNPVPLAYIDIAPLDFGENGQQERADASGRWDVFDMRAGRYHITASAAGRGVVAETIVAPRRDISLRLSGTGRIAGTTTELVDGSFELTFHHCGAAADPIEVDDDARIVVVRGGRFTIDRVPACSLTMTARWRDKLLTHGIVVEPDATAYVELALGTPRDKLVRGTVRDDTGKPVSNARITALVENREVATVRSDGDGRYEMTVQAGATVVAGNGKRVGRATVGRANVSTEQVDIALDESAESN